MSCQVFNTVLPLAEWIGRERSKNPGPMFLRALVVGVYVFHAHHDRASPEIIPLFGDDDGAIANVELRAMVRDQDPNSESKDRA